MSFLLAIIMPSAALAGTISVTNLNSSFALGEGVEAGLGEIIQFNGTNFTEYANSQLALVVFLENQSARWDKTNLQWDFPVLVNVDAGGNFVYNWSLPYPTENVFPGINPLTGQYVMPGLQRVAVANKSVLGGMFWTKRNSTGTAQAVWGDSSKIYVGYSSGIVMAFNKSSFASTNYFGNNMTGHHNYTWTSQLATTGTVEAVWSDGDYVYTTQSTAARLRSLNATDGSQIYETTPAAIGYSIWGNGTNLYVGMAAGTEPTRYTINLTSPVNYASTPAISSIAYGLWADSERLYVCYGNGAVYAYNLSTLDTTWYVQNTTLQCNGIFGDDDAVYSGYSNGKLYKHNKTNGLVIWNATDYTYSREAGAAVNINSLWVGSNYVYTLHSDGRVLYWNKTSGTAGLFPHHVYQVSTGASAGNAIYGDEDYVYAAHSSGWLFKLGQENKNLEWHPEAAFWIRDLADTWNFIMKPTKPIFADNETLAFEFMAFDNKTNPVDVTSPLLRGTYSYSRTTRHYSQWEAAGPYNLTALDPRISTSWSGGMQWRYYENLTTAACPSTHYDYTGAFANKTGWYILDGGSWCLYHNESVPSPVYTTMNGTKLPTYELATVRPAPMINSSATAWYGILANQSNPYGNLTKYYGTEKYTWYAVFGTHPTSFLPQSGVLGLAKKAGNSYEYAWSDAFGRSDLWRVSRTGTTDSRYMYARYSLAQNATPFEFYWILADWNSPYITSGVEKATMAMATPINTTIGSDEEAAGGWSIDGSLFYHRRNITFTEPGIIERVDEPVNFTIDPLGNITAGCRDIRITDNSSNLAVFQNETCSANSVNLWLFLNLTQNQQKNFTVYYNSTASAPSFTLMDVTTSGSCPSQTINLRRMNLAYDTNYTKSYNWTAWGVSSGENLQFNFGSTSAWMSNNQNHYWAFNNGTAPSASVYGWSGRCMLQSGPIFTKMSMNQTTLATTLNVSLGVFGTVYVFQKSGLVKIIMQPNRTVVDGIDGYPAYYRYGFAGVSPQGITGTSLYHAWTDWAGRKEGLDKTVLGEPLENYTYDGKRGVPIKATFRSVFPAAFALNYKASQPACTGNQIVNYFAYRRAGEIISTYAAIGESWMWDFGICHRDIYSNVTRYGTGWTLSYPDLRMYGTTWNRWVDAANYARFYLYQNNFTPFSRESRFYSFVGAKYTTARATLAALDMCPDVEHGYNGYDEMLNNITSITIPQMRVTSGNYACLMNVLKMVDSNGADKAEFIMAKNVSVYYGDVERVDEPYPTAIVSGAYTQSASNLASYRYGSWFTAVSPHPYIIHGYGTSGNPQFIGSYTYYWQAPQQYFNKFVFDESYFWNKNETGLLGGSGVDIGTETQDPLGFTCNPASVSGSILESLERKGWTHTATVVNTCPYSQENMKHYLYARPSWSGYISTSSGGSTGTTYDFYIFGKNNYSAQVGTDNSLFDYKHNPDGNSTYPLDIGDLNETERHMNKQPWVCYESSRINRSFCIAETTNSSFIYSAAGGATTEQTAFGQDYSSTRELNRFLFYTNTRWTGGAYYPYDYYLYHYILGPFLNSKEFDVNLLYAGPGLSENKMGMIFPDAWKPLMQGYPQGFDAGNRFWVYFDKDSRQYYPTYLSVNGTLFKNDRRVGNATINLTIYKNDGSLLANETTKTDGIGRFNWTCALSSASDGQHYLKASYNNGEIENKFGFRIDYGVVLSVSTPSTTLVSPIEGGQTFDVTSSITNGGPMNATNIAAVINYTGAFQVRNAILDISNVTNIAGMIAPGSKVVINWTVGSTGVPAGSYTFCIKANASENRNEVAGCTDVTIQRQVSTTTTVTSVQSGGGGTTYVAVGGGGPAVEAITVKQQEKLFQTKKTYEVVRGREESFILKIENPFDSPMVGVSVNVSGLLAKYLEIRPDRTGKIAAGKSFDFTVQIEAPKYFTEGEHKLTFAISSTLNKTTTTADNKTEITTTSLNETRAVVLLIHEIPKDEALSYLSESTAIVEEMKQMGFDTEEVGQLLSKADANFKKSVYGDTIVAYQMIKDKKDQAFSAQSLLRENEERIKEAAAEGLKVPGTARLLSLAKAAMERGDFASALKRAEEAKMTYALETVGKINPVYFVRKNWPPLLAGGLGFFITLYTGSIGLRLRGMNRRIRSLKEEENILLGLIRETQRECFELGKLSMEEYGNSIFQYEKRLGDVVRETISLENRKSQLFRMIFRKEKEILLRERKKLLELMRETQGTYLEAGKLETRIYENKMRSYKERLAEIEESLADITAREVMKKSFFGRLLAK